MVMKDWILLIVPIISNGIIIFIAQKYLGKKLESRLNMRYEVIKDFLRKLHQLNNAFIQANIETIKTEDIKKPEIIKDNLTIIQEFILELIKYYDTNQYDLNGFAIFFYDLQKKWQDFQNTYNESCDKKLDDKMRIKLGEKLQLVKDSNQKLINEVRNKY